MENDNMKLFANIFIIELFEFITPNFKVDELIT